MSTPSRFRMPSLSLPRMRRSRTNSSQISETTLVSSPTSDDATSDDAGKKETALALPTPPSIAKNIFVVSLQTLGSVSRNIPFCTALNGVIEPLLDVLNRLDQSMWNQRALADLAARIDSLRMIVARSEASNGQVVIERLQRELASIQRDLEQAMAQGKVAQFFNSNDDASAISRHNDVLTTIIIDSTFENVSQLSETVHNLRVSQVSSLQQTGQTSQVDAVAFERRIVITGGVGGAGGHGYIGGEGGDGEGPNVDLRTMQANVIMGGVGGVGGNGIHIGGKGGAGAAPVIRYH
ncbi:hypothetical protein MIND_00873000 [Mycena indigotica]|uniref:Uncharacterized protein n=1 Tax=Mycena indigotica TaxID=2126181 RepID=A0A8H6SHV6_9AGAR|nr:uncharacterized protein MIND_00873000 [Mycena indigotica]KAF7299243.1 hypothetical protein MIND_00873000 [Mycena indigotica]